MEENQAHLGLLLGLRLEGGPGTFGAALRPWLEMGLAQLGWLWGLGWSGAWHRWGRFGARAGAGTVEALSGPRRKGAQAQPVPWGLGWRRTWHSWGCLWSQDGGGPGTVGAALGPRMEEDQAQLGLLWGPSWKGAWHSWGCFGAWAGGGPGTVEACSFPRPKGAPAQPGPWVLGWSRTRHSWGCPWSQDGGGHGTAGAALGSRMEKDQAQLGLCWG